MDKRDFIAIIAPIAVKLRLEGSSLFPSVRIAQAILETGGVIHEWNNLVGFKVGSGNTNAYWRGRSVSTKTWEVYGGLRQDNVTANWRAYDCIDDCFCDQDLLFGRDRYARVRGASTPHEQTAALYACGYATDPGYPSKLANIIGFYGLTKYDEEVKKMIDELKVQIAELNAKVAELEGNAKLAEIPAWAKGSVDRALKNGLLAKGSEKNGSFDFYRMITLLDRKGLV